MKDKSRTVYLVARIYYLIREQMDVELAKEGLTSLQYSVLSLIRGSDGLSSAQLARRYRVKPQSMNRVVQDLEAKGLIERTVDRENRKVLVAILSTAGKETLRRCDRLIDSYEGEIFDTISPDDLDAFRRVAKVVIDKSAL